MHDLERWKKQQQHLGYSASNLGQIKTNPTSLAQLVQELWKKEEEGVKILPLKTIGFCTLTTLKPLVFQAKKNVSAYFQLNPTKIAVQEFFQTIF